MCRWNLSPGWIISLLSLKLPVSVFHSDRIHHKCLYKHTVYFRIPWFFSLRCVIIIHTQSTFSFHNSHTMCHIWVYSHSDHFNLLLFRTVYFISQCFSQCTFSVITNILIFSFVRYIIPTFVIVIFAFKISMIFPQCPVTVTLQSKGNNTSGQ